MNSSEVILKRPGWKFHRRAITAYLALMVVARDATAATPIRLGQSVDLSGPLRDLGLAAQQGANAAFLAINATGGVNGRLLELVTLDDGYSVERAKTNLNSFLKDPTIFGLFNCMGTPTVEAMLPAIAGSGVPFFAPFTGALSVRRKDMPNVVNIRSSYAQETHQLVRHLSTIGIKKIGAVYLNNSFGSENLNSARQAVKDYKIASFDAFPIEVDGRNAEAVASALAKSDNEAILVLLGGKATVDFVIAMRRARKGLPLYALSVLGSASSIRAMGEHGIGITMAQVVPSPSVMSNQVVRDFTLAWKNAKFGTDPSHVALEAYINARAFAEYARKAGEGLTRQTFINAVYKYKLDFGGFPIEVTAPGRNGSTFIELSMLSLGGKFVR